MSNLVIVGAGGFGREVAALVEAINAAAATPPWTLLGFVDDAPDLHQTTQIGYPVLGATDRLARPASEADAYVIAIGHGPTRRTLARRLSTSPASPATLVHPSVDVHRSVTLGPGCILCAGVTPTVDVTLGAHVIVNLHATLGHDADVGDFTTIHPGGHLSGNTRLGVACEVGTGAVMLPGTSADDDARIGAGAVVTRDVSAGTTVVGIPARPL